MFYLFIKAWICSIAPPLHDPTSVSVSEATSMPRQRGDERGAPAHNRQHNSHGVCSEVIPEVHATLLQDLCSHILRGIYSYLKKRQLQHHILFKLPKSRCARVFKRGCSVVLVSAALLVIHFQCRSLKNTIRCFLGNGAWIYFHQIKHWCSLTTSRLESQKADFLKKKSPFHYIFTEIYIYIIYI